ncbi:MAG: RecQ family ATP-dependent DNA helicase [Opitutales bacterium]
MRHPRGSETSKQPAVAATSDPRPLLRERFGLGAFRPPQEAIIADILAGRDTLVIMPTGGGKSLCYQLPALMLDGVTLVVSPLIALMKDQVDALTAKGIPAAMLNSALSWDEQRATLDRMRAGALKIVYVAPERFRARSFTDSLAACRIALLAVDEAHCISQWGHDFRPDYMRLGEAVEACGRPQCVALTATATPEVREDIQAQLSLRQPAVYVAGFGRPNLTFNVRPVERKQEKAGRLNRLIEAHGAGIVYCATRKSVEAVADQLREDGHPHVAYHGGLSDGAREAAQNRFIRKEVPLAVATNAFGMGIDRDDIRFVCHYDMPGSVEAYYQEAGRAGRDGKPAWCELLFCYPDKQIQDFFIEGSNPSPQLIRDLYAYLRHNRDREDCLHLSVDDLADSLPGKINPMALSSALSLLRKQGLIERFQRPGSRLRSTRILKPELDPAAIPVDAEGLAVKRERDEDKLKRLIQFAYARSCRQAWILDYFGQPDAEPCGRCDACLRGSADRRKLNEEESLVVKKALSGVARMSDRKDQHRWQPRFGRDRIVKMLLGSRSQAITQSGLDRLSTWGLLRPYGTPFVNRLFDALEAAGYVARTGGEYPLLKLTATGSRVLLDENEPRLAWPETGQAETPAAAGPPDSGLLEKLMAKRNQLARARNNAPAYTIFPNTVLEQLAAQRPTTPEAALTIKGIGPQKAKKLLPTFLKIIQEHEGGGRLRG